MAVTASSSSLLSKLFLSMSKLLTYSRKVLSGKVVPLSTTSPYTGRHDNNKSPDNKTQIFIFFMISTSLMQISCSSLALQVSQKPSQAQTFLRCSHHRQKNYCCYQHHRWHQHYVYPGYHHQF